MTLPAKTFARIGRRRFLKTSTAMATGMLAGGSSLSAFPSIGSRLLQPDSLINGVQIGVITYSYRSMPDQSAEATLQYIIDSGISAVELMGDPAETFAGRPDQPFDRSAMWRLMRKQRSDEALSDNEKKELMEMQEATERYRKAVAAWRGQVSSDKFKMLKKMFAAAGVSIYGFKPGAFGKDNTDAEINYGMSAAKALGANHVTLEHPSDDTHTARLGRLAAKHKIKVAYHGHEQQTPTFWDTALSQSKYNMLNADIGHYVAAGYPDVAGLLKAKHERISSIHMKDRQSPANGKGNLVWGKGDTPLVETLQLMRDKKYKFPGTIELEYQIPEGSDAVQEVKKCLEYCRAALEG